MVSLLVVDKLPSLDDSTELIQRRRGERTLVRIHPDRHTHPGLLSSAHIRCDQREDIQAFDLVTLLSSHFRWPGLGRRDGQVRSQRLASKAFGVTSGRLPETLREEESPPADSHACAFT